MIKTVSIVALALAACAGTALAGDVAAGETSFKKCAPCHDVGETAKNKLGPILNGLDGRKAGAVVAGYNSSDASKKSGIVWNETTFKEFVKDPKAKMPGTKMVFAGIKNDKELDDLWSYLQRFGPDGKKK